jgi:hypothetical protein
MVGLHCQHHSVACSQGILNNFKAAFVITPLEFFANVHQLAAKLKISSV